MRLHRSALGALAGAVALASLAGPVLAQTLNPDPQQQLNSQILEAGQHEAAALRALQQTRDRRASIDARVAELDGQLTAVQAQLAPLEAESSRLAAALDDAQAQLAARQAEYDAVKREFDVEAAQIYRSDRRGAAYDYVSAARPQQLVQGGKYLDQVNVRRRQLLHRVEVLRDEIEAQRNEIADQKEQADANTQQVQHLRDQIADMRAEIEPVRAQAADEQANEERQLAAIRAQKVAYEKELAALQATSDSITALLQASQHPGVAGACDDRPVAGAIVSGFGNRVDPISGATGVHAGVDLAAAMGTPIHACRSGVVRIASAQGGYGNAVVIENGGGMATLYGHQSKLAVSVGERVDAGDVIGYVGSTGNSTGPHLHFEVRLSGYPVNPVPYL